jgi:solute carrier family 25 carnitine/acylcarnitine transporter 20/29
MISKYLYCFFFYTKQKNKGKMVLDWGFSGKSEPVAQFLSGGLAGVAAWTSIYPIDVVKSRVQSSKHLSMGDAFIDGWKQGGVRSFFQGFSTTVAKGFVCSGVTFLGVEIVMLAIEKFDKN